MEPRAAALSHEGAALTYALVYIGDQVRELVGQREVVVIDDRSEHRPSVPTRLLDPLLWLEKAAADLFACWDDEIERGVAVIELRSAVRAVARARSVVDANETAVEWARSVGRDVRLEDGEVRPSEGETRATVCSCERSDAEMRADESPAKSAFGELRFARDALAKEMVERLRDLHHEIRTTATALLWDKRSMMPEHSEEIIEDVLNVVEGVLDDSAS